MSPGGRLLPGDEIYRCDLLRVRHVHEGAAAVESKLETLRMNLEGDIGELGTRRRVHDRQAAVP